MSAPEGSGSGAAGAAEPVRWRGLLGEARRALAGVEEVCSPEVDARRIVEAASGADPATFDSVLAEPATRLGAGRFHEMLQRRIAGEPLQYVVGSWGFRTLDLMIDRRVLIPRPETEAVAGWAIAEVQRRAVAGGGAAAGKGAGEAGAAGGGAAAGKGAGEVAAAGGGTGAGEVAVVDLGTGSGAAGGGTGAGEVAVVDLGTGSGAAGGGTGAGEVAVVDLGTGSGAIALSVAVECPSARVFATDVSAEALSVARANLSGLGRAAARVSLHEGDWYEALPAGLRGSVDVVVSNPPYIGTAEELPPLVADWEPPVALWAGPVGDEAVHQVIDGSLEWLRPGGTVIVEVASHRARQAASIAASAGLSDIRVERDLAGLDRIVIATRPATRR